MSELKLLKRDSSEYFMEELNELIEEGWIPLFESFQAALGTGFKKQYAILLKKEE